jgi:signal transduction histidine kinase/DNA-binding response OmpR family regulator
MRSPTILRGRLRQIALSRTGMWLTGGALTTACFAALCFAALVAARSAADQRAETVASQMATMAAHDMARTIERFDVALQTTVDRLRSPTVAALNEPVRGLVLFDASFGLPSLGFINVLDEGGVVAASSTPSERGGRWASRSYFTTQRVNPSLGLYVSEPFGQAEYASIALSRRVSHDDGTFGGVVVASLRLSYFRDLLGQLAVGPPGTIAVLRTDGTVIMRMPFDRNDIGRTAPPDAQSDQVRRRFVVQQIGELPLAVHVGIANEDVAGAWQDWTVAQLVAGVLLAAIGSAVIVALRREVRQREIAERDNRRKSDYLMMASHELRTPLHSIVGNADCLRADPHLDPANARRVTAIMSAGNHLRGVVDRILNELQIEVRIPTPRMRQVALAKLLDACVIIVESHAAQRGLALRYDLKKGAPESFVTDPDLLKQVLVNLLSNAIKFTSPGGAVVLEVAGTADQIAIQVKDTGCGIPPDQRHKLFQFGERLGAEQIGIPGHGIGLAMSRRLIKCMGGDTGYRENLGVGSVFWATLPAGRLTEQAAPPALSSLPPKQALRVLLVDDVIANREIARGILIERGHVVTEAETGAGAVQLATDNDFDVVLMDMRMPGMDGCDATKHIRKIAGIRGVVPVVAVTANALDEQIVEGRHAGMVEHLVKPFSAEELLTVVERVAVRCPPVTLREPPNFDSDVLAQLAPYMSSDDMERHLLDLTRKVEVLLREIEMVDAASDQSRIADLSHEMAGTAGMFGFAALAVAAQRLDAALLENGAPSPDLADALALAARAALAELRGLTSAEPVGSA